jgi:SAM-dependent methyltransferase
MPAPLDVDTRAEAEHAYLAGRAMPSAYVRITGRVGSELIVRAPWLWPLLRRPAKRTWERMAGVWDATMQPDRSDHLAPLVAACDRLVAAPARILEVGAGTGAGSTHLAHRFPDADVTGVDLSDAMVGEANAKRDDHLRSRLRFEVGDGSALPYPDASFDLVTLLNVPPFVDEIARVLRPDGAVVVAHSLGPATPSYTSDRRLQRALTRRGFDTVETGRSGAGTYVVARR